MKTRICIFLLIVYILLPVFIYAAESGIKDGAEEERQRVGSLYLSADSRQLEDEDGNELYNAAEIKVFDEEEPIFAVSPDKDEWLLMTADLKKFGGGSKHRFYTLYFDDIKIYAAGAENSPYDIKNMKYYDTDGDEIDLLNYLSECGYVTYYDRFSAEPRTLSVKTEALQTVPEGAEMIDKDIIILSSVIILFLAAALNSAAKQR